MVQSAAYPSVTSLGGGGKHPAALQMAALGPAAIQDGCELPGDGELKRRTGLRVVDAEDERLPVHSLPPERQHLAAPHARVHAEPEHVPEGGIGDNRVWTLPLMQAFSLEGRGMRSGASVCPARYRTSRVFGNAAYQPNQNARCAGRRRSTRPSSAVSACSSMVQIVPDPSSTPRSPS